MGRCRAGRQRLLRAALLAASLSIFCSSCAAITLAPATQSGSSLGTGSAAFVTASIPVGSVVLVQLSSTAPLGTGLSSNVKLYGKWGSLPSTSVGSYDELVTGTGAMSMLLVAEKQCTGTAASEFHMLLENSGSSIDYAIQYTTVSCHLTSSSITGISPADGPLAGGRRVTLTGVQMALNLADVELLTIKNVPATIISAGPTEGAVLLVSSSYGLVRSVNNVFTVNVGPTITRVEPTRGPLHGNYTVTITGTNLAADLADLLTVTFGGVPVLSVDSFSTTVIVARTGNATTINLPPGVVDVVVTSTRFGAARLASGFTYLPRVGARCAGTVAIDLLASRGHNLLNDAAGSGATVPTPTGQYGSNSYCTWVLAPVAAAAKQFYISFHYLDVRNGSFFLSSGDFLDIYSTALVGSATTRSYEAIISASALTFVFTSDAADEGAGFQLGYSTGFCQRGVPVVFTDSKRTNFEDGSGSYDYGMYSQCDFKIVPTDVQTVLRVQLVLEKLDLADGSTLTIYDGDSPSALQLVQLPNPQYTVLPIRVTSSSPKMYIRLVTGAQTTKAGTDTGFKAFYDQAVSYYIDSVVPKEGPLRGGNVVTLYGNNMTTGGVADIRTVNIGNIPVLDVLEAVVISVNRTRIVVVVPDLSPLTSGSINVDVAVDSATTGVSVGYSLYKTLAGEVCPYRWQTEQSASEGGLLLRDTIDQAIGNYSYNPLWSDPAPAEDPNAYGCELHTFSNTTLSVKEDLGPAFGAIAPSSSWSGALAGLCANATYSGCVPFADAVKASVGDALYSDPSGSRMEALQFAAQAARQRGVARFHISLNQIAYQLSDTFTWAANATSCDWPCGLTTASTTCGGRSGPNLYSSVFTISYGC
eukprot:tig00020848_g14608.t1